MGKLVPSVERPGNDQNFVGQYFLLQQGAAAAAVGDGKLACSWYSISIKMCILKRKDSSLLQDISRLY